MQREPDPVRQNQKPPYVPACVSRNDYNGSERHVKCIFHAVQEIPNAAVGAPNSVRHTVCCAAGSGVWVRQAGGGNDGIDVSEEEGGLGQGVVWRSVRSVALQRHFSLNKDKKTHLIYLGKKREERAKEYSANYKTLLAIVEEMTLLNMRLLKGNACL